MAKVIQRAQERRAKLQAEIAQIDSFIMMYETLDRDASNEPDDEAEARQLGHDDPPVFTPVMSGLTMPAAPVKGARGPRGSSPDAIVGAALDALRQKNAPMTRYELVDAVQAAGLTVGGSDKPRNMGTILWRSQAFENDGDGYRPKAQ